MMYEKQIANINHFQELKDCEDKIFITSVCAASGLTGTKDSGIGVVLRIVINELSGEDGRFICLSP